MKPSSRTAGLYQPLPQPDCPVPRPPRAPAALRAHQAVTAGLTYLLVSLGKEYTLTSRANHGSPTTRKGFSTISARQGADLSLYGLRWGCRGDHGHSASAGFSGRRA